MERLNGSLIQTLEKIMEGKPKETWPQYIKHALLVSRVRTNQGTGYSPFELTYGYKPEITKQNNQPYVKIPKG